MKENTNGAIAVNTAILYIRLAIVSVCGLAYTRFGLQALGVTDYGMFSVVACIITFATVINTVMVATSNRFIATAIGRGDEEETNRQFNVNLLIHILIAVVTAAVALPAGHWYIDHYVNYDGSLSDVRMVYDVSMSGWILSFVGVPYNGLLLARERFLVFCSTDVLSSVVKLVVSYLLIDHFSHKLLIYALVTAFMTGFPTFVFIYYCHRKFPEITRPKFVRGWGRYREVLGFSVGIAIGALASIVKSQGGALIVNAFFSAAMNAGLAIANSVCNILLTFANNAQKSISPQIVKNYAKGDLDRSSVLVCLASRVTYLSMFTVAVPFLLVPEKILDIWLAETPPYSVTFIRLFIVDLLILSINAGINDFIFASGRIKLYQIVINGFLVLSVITGYMVMKAGYAPEYLFYVYIFFSLVIFIIRPLLLARVVKFDIRMLIVRSYIPVFGVTLLFLPVFLVKAQAEAWIGAWSLLAIAYAYYFLLTWTLGLTAGERTFLTGKLKSLWLKAGSKNCL